jgi:type VI secretion system secreted protein VgrG
VQANAVGISSWDPAQLLAPGAEQQSALDAGELPTLAVYDGGGERIASAIGEPDHYSQLMLQALELDNKIFEGEGAARQLAAGHAIALTQHEYYGDDNRFKVLWAGHEARNNVLTGVANPFTKSRCATRPASLPVYSGVRSHLSEICSDGGGRPQQGNIPPTS